MYTFSILALLSLLLPPVSGSESAASCATKTRLGGGPGSLVVPEMARPTILRRWAKSRRYPLYSSVISPLVRRGRDGIPKSSSEGRKRFEFRDFDILPNSSLQGPSSSYDSESTSLHKPFASQGLEPPEKKRKVVEFYNFDILPNANLQSLSPSNAYEPPSLLYPPLYPPSSLHPLPSSPDLSTVPVQTSPTPRQSSSSPKTSSSERPSKRRKLGVSLTRGKAPKTHRTPREILREKKPSMPRKVNRERPSLLGEDKHIRDKVLYHAVTPDPNRSESLVKARPSDDDGDEFYFRRISDGWAHQAAVKYKLKTLSWLNPVHSVSLSYGQKRKYPWPRRITASSGEKMPVFKSEYIPPASYEERKTLTPYGLNSYPGWYRIWPKTQLQLSPDQRPWTMEDLRLNLVRQHHYFPNHEAGQADSEYARLDKEMRDMCNTEPCKPQNPRGYFAPGYFDSERSRVSGYSLKRLQGALS